MLFRALAATAALAAFVNASPVLQKRQGGGTDLPTYREVPNGNGGYKPCDDSTSGSSYLDPIVESVPEGVDPKTWKGYTTENEPYANAALIIGNPTTNGTNTTMAWKGQPAGGLLENDPNYAPKSNFDFQSLNLALNQELIELDLFHYLLAKFSPEEWSAIGLTADDRTLTQHMANQEVGHAVAITNMIGVDRAAKQCVYEYPFTTLKEGILWNALLTRCLRLHQPAQLAPFRSDPPSINHDGSKAATRISADGRIASDARVTYAWTLLSPYIKSCPPNNPRIEFTRFPLLNVTNQPSALEGVPGINSNYTLTEGAGRRVDLYWEPLGKTVSYDGLYKTESMAGEPKYLAFFDQLNVTFAPLMGVDLEKRVAHAFVPNATVYPTQPQVVNTAFVALVDDNSFVTVYNSSNLNNHTVAVGIYQAS
ncbi:hypothetical protein BMF94_4550 [Rhodotorula taiwanensis]|uniref:Uncharacterized protein n=1 Tax=Rhodotorula taiwanensis TaxID=741276 RepID=A0A2S5B7H3_9BASI|nr:hypothetical protein BMF94_4550 [Rhodotorula taiwanensis]